MIRNQIYKEVFDMIYGWGQFHIDPDSNDLYFSPAFRKSMQEVELLPQLAKAEEANRKDYEECAEHFGLTVDSVEFAAMLAQPF